MTITEIMIWILLGLLMGVLFYFLHKKFAENNVWNHLTESYKNNMDKKLFDEAEFISKFGTIENKSMFYKLDRLILTSGIKRYLSWMNGERFLIILIVSVIAGIAEGMVFTGNGLVALFIGALQFVLLYVIVLGLSGRTYNQIEDSTSLFVSILSNHAKGSSDIVTIMQRTLASTDGPMRELVSRFLLDCERTGNIDMAFDYMKESVDNRQLQTIIVNLKNCMHYQANYEEVLGQMIGQIAASLTAREKRKNILFSMKLTLIVISVASAFIVMFIGNGIGVDVKQILTTSLVGQAILFVTGIMYLFVVIKLFGTDK